MSSGGITGLIVQHQLLILLVVAVVIAGLLIDLIPDKKRRGRWRERKPWGRDRWRRDIRLAGGTDYRPGPLDPADQLRLVMGGDFTSRPVLNKSEARVFKELGKIVAALNPTWQVMAQVSLGEILTCKDRETYGCVNSKRVDLLLIDNDCWPRHAIEYQGDGHYQGGAAARDAVKKEALRRAGIGYIEVAAGKTTPADLRRLLEKLVDKPETPKPEGA